MLQVQMEKPQSPDGQGCWIFFFFFFFPERERRRAGIDLSSLPISLKFQINKIHFSAPLPSPLQQTKEKQFPAVCSKLLSPPFPGHPPAPRSQQRLGDPSSEGTQRGHPVIPRCLQASTVTSGCCFSTFPAPPSMGFAGSQQDPSRICCSHHPRMATPFNTKSPQKQHFVRAHQVSQSFKVVKK